MKPIRAIVQAGSFFALLCLMASAAAAPVSPINQSLSSQVLPVLVHVDADGQITSVAPAVDLSPRLTRLLRSNLDDMITGPAVRDGRAVSSQFVIHVAHEKHAARPRQLRRAVRLRLDGARARRILVLAV